MCQTNLSIGYTPRARCATNYMTTQNSKIRLISSIALIEVKVDDNLVINLLLANFIGQFKLVIVQVLLSPVYTRGELGIKRIGSRCTLLCCCYV